MARKAQSSSRGSEEDPPPGEARDVSLGALPEPSDPLRAAERDLVRRAQQGEEGAFEALVHQHQQRAFRVARNMVPGDEDARDLVQEAFLRVFRNLDRFDFQYAFATWLHRIVTNLAIDHLRRRRVLSSSQLGPGDDDEAGELDLPDVDAPPPSRRLEAEETAQRVRDCIASLAPHFQSVLTLRELEGLPCTEIARIVGATHVTVRWRLHRGRKLFQEEWERRERHAAGAGRGANIPPSASVQDGEDDPSER